MTLFVLGNVAKDSFYYLNNFRSSGETIISEKTLNDIGGKGFNQLIAARRLGVEVSFWTCTGSDETSEKIFQILFFLTLDSRQAKTLYMGVAAQNRDFVNEIIFVFLGRNAPMRVAVTVWSQ